MSLLIIFLDDGTSEQADSLSTSIESESPVITLALEDADFKTFQCETWSNQFLEKINITIPPYGYQRELVQNAIRAKNTIVCLRTSGGKTFVAGSFPSRSIERNGILRFSVVNQILFAREELFGQWEEIPGFFYCSTPCDA